MARLILSLALLLSAAEWVTCQSDSIRPEVKKDIIPQDALLKRLSLLEANLFEQNAVQNELLGRVRSLEVEKTNLLEHQNKMQAKLDALELENANLINLVETLEKKFEAFERKSDTGTQKMKTKAVTPRPTSCRELFFIGHTLNGFYQVEGIGANANKIETIYCDFEQQSTSPDFENRLGVVDVKSSPVYFYVQRSTSFPTHNAVVPFELERLNVGGAMNLTSGTFTAPVNGIYHFAFSGIKNTAGVINIRLRVNGNLIGDAGSGYHDTWVTLSLHSTLRLRTGDRVDLLTDYGSGGTLYEDYQHFTHFSGWLLEEDLPF